MLDSVRCQSKRAELLLLLLTVPKVPDPALPAGGVRHVQVLHAPDEQV